MRSRWLTPCVVSAASLVLFSSVRSAADIEHSMADQGAVQIDPEAIPHWRVGQLFILGSDEIPDGIILEQCPLFPGEPVSIADLREAEANLARLRLFVVDQKRGIRPTVKILDPDDAERRYFDIEIKVEEKPNATQLLAIRESIRFVADWRAWGPCAAVYRAEGFPRDILELLTDGKIREIPSCIGSRFRTRKRTGIGFAPPAAVLP